MLTQYVLAGERQEALTLDGIAPDHLARYRWAAEKLSSTSRVIDIACGNGYGSSILAAAGHTVHGVDANWDAIIMALDAYASERTRFEHARIEDVVLTGLYDAAVCLETLEHLENPGQCLDLIYSRLRIDGLLLASVPNQAVVPYSEDAHPHHMRHFTWQQFEDLLEKHNFTVDAWYSQIGKWKDFEVVPGRDGKVLIAVCLPIL